VTKVTSDFFTVVACKKTIFSLIEAQSGLAGDGTQIA
jgi:hypothetical protein